MRYLKASKLLLLNIFAALMAACTAHYTVNNNITNVEPVKRYSLQFQAGSEKSDELLLILTFSGGGTRAAALSYGVLQVLADTQISIGGRPRRLLDEVDVISSVSGGSFTSAYYGLFGDRIFEDFETRFLKRNVEGDLALGLIAPKNWPKLMSSYYARSDFAADFFDDILFEKKNLR